MDNWFLLYLLTRLDFASGIAIFFMVASGTATVAFTILASIMYAERESDRIGFGEDSQWFKKDCRWFDTWKRLARAAVLIAIPSAIVAVLVPSKTDVFFIVGGSTLIEAVHSDAAKRIGSKSLEAVESWLDQNMPKKAEPAK